MHSIALLDILNALSLFYLLLKERLKKAKHWQAAQPAEFERQTQQHRENN